MPKTAKKSAVPLLLTISILSVFLIQQLHFLITPAIADFGMYYDNPSLAVYISTVVNLGCIIASFVAGIIAGKRIGYKPLAIIALSLVLIAGVLPFFLGTNLIAVLICRVFFGIGQGLALPVCNMLIIGFYNGIARDRMLGISTFLVNLSGMLYQLVGGAVCSIDVRYTWLVHAIIVIPLIFCFFLKEPPAVKTELPIEHIDTHEEKAPDKKGKLIPAKFIVISLGYGLAFLLFYPAMLNMSSIIINEGIGDAGTAGIITAIYSIGGTIGGALYPICTRIFRRQTVSVSWVALTAALACGAFGGNIVFLGICMFLGGAALHVAMPAILGMVAYMVPPKGQALASSVYWMAFNSCGFLSAVWINLLAGINSGTRFPLYIGMFGMAALTVVWFFFTMRKRVVIKSA